MKFSFTSDSRPLDGYTIRRPIHRGGFGEVYYAISDGGKEVALKLLHTNRDVELRGVSQCLNLKHPNLITIFDVRRDAEGDQWVVMEYVRGDTLADRLEHSPNGLSLSETAEWLDGIAEGLEYLHQRGVVHRDLKPANIFRDNGVVKIGDIGLSKLISESRQSVQTQSVGTVHYMAPEVARGRYGRHVDIYSLGVMLCEMLTGKVPFDGETTAEILMKHLTDEPNPAAIPMQFRKLLMQALAKDPTQRTSAVTDLRKEFHILSQQSTGESRATGTDDGRPATDSVDSTAAPGTVRTGQFVSSRWLPAWLGDRPLWQTVCLGLVLVWLMPSLLRMISWQTLVLCGVTWGLWLFFRNQKVFPAGDMGAAVDQQTDHQLPALMSAGSTADSRGTNRLRPGRPRRIRMTTDTVRRIPLRQRSQQTLLSSMLAMVFSTGVATLLYLLSAESAESLIPGVAEACFVAVSVWLLSLSVLIPVRFMEGRGLSRMSRRLVTCLTGIITGAATFWLVEFLLLSDSSLFQTSGTGWLGWTDPGASRLLVVSENQTPTLAGFQVFSCALLGLRSWWTQADSFRRTRLRISSVLLSSLFGWILSVIVPFPATLGTVIALSLSVVIQLGSSWTPPEQRILEPQRNPQPEIV